MLRILPLKGHFGSEESIAVYDYIIMPKCICGNE